ncbi:hypothetical protein MRB53_026303 [Persea americana]|uniref:Uncharacterized protein n=1 Tax=Persea americana TaxID=3435 RepID=A0ACC2LHK5_PERAE|nr:hypothetical protein MRB53_026303 [Persea americana]
MIGNPNGQVGGEEGASGASSGCSMKECRWVHRGRQRVRRRRKMGAAAASGDAAMGGRAAAARQGFRGVAATCVWRIEMVGDDEHADGARGIAAGGKEESERETREAELQMTSSGAMG